MRLIKEQRKSFWSRCWGFVSPGVGKRITTDRIFEQSGPEKDKVSEIDITMTAVLRPGLLNETLRRIVENVVDKKERFRLIINVDPVGEDVNPIEVVKVAQKYFSNVVYNIPEKPSFPKAVKWLWQQAEAPYVFHWEDDVFIYRPIDVLHMIDIMNKYKKLAALRLFKYSTKNGKTIHVFGSIWNYKEEGFYLARRSTEQFGLNPNLIKLKFVKEAALLFDDNLNPEKQFRLTGPMKDLITKWKFGLYTKPGDRYLIRGLGGKKWKEKYGFVKGKVAFTEWEKE